MFISESAVIWEIKKKTSGLPSGFVGNTGIQVEKVSTLIQTEPYGYREQDEFLNGCLKLRTRLPPKYC
ncbi:MAG: 2-amino-4-hydroxy-6-hydroxymethyldihydropteridine diphosphokinase [Frisingicoccus sp.]